MKRRNSLIELFRFIFALNVVKGHGMFIYEGPYFGHGRLSVEFFFILTGFLLVRSVTKHLDKPFFKGFFSFYWSKIKPILIPVLIVIPFNIAYCVLNNSGLNIWGFLWYVKQMLIYIPIFFILRYFIKKESIFITIVGVICLVATIMNCTSTFYEMGEVRAFMGISIGVLLAYVPKIKLKHQNILWIVVIPLMLMSFASIIFGLNMWEEKVLQLVIYPILIYFTFQLDVNNKVFNYLGALSFGLYAFQCVVRIFPLVGINNVWISFSVIVILTILEDGIKRIIMYYKNKKLKPAK